MPALSRFFVTSPTSAADGVIVVSPSNLKIDGLSAQGETALRVVEEYPPLVGDWTGFAARHFDLREIFTLRIHADGQVTEVRVRPESPKLRLEGELVRGIEVRDTPMVFRATPSVNVPVRNRRAVADCESCNRKHAAGQRGTERSHSMTGWFRLSMLLELPSR